MANVFFKRGTQAQLNTLRQGGSFVDGSFYLTTDTDRLYVAQSASELVELNKSITVYDSVSAVNAIPASDVEVGQFVYIAPSGGGENVHNGNILAVCTAKSENAVTWTQVNPDTDTNNYLRAVTATQGTAASDGSIPYTLVFTIKDKTGADLASGGTITASFSVPTKDLLDNVEIVTSATANNNIATITSKIENGAGNTATYSVGSQFAIAAGENITISTTGTNNIVISSAAGADSFKLDAVSASNAVTLALKDSASGNAHGKLVELTGERGLSILQESVASTGTYATSAQVIKIGHSATAAPTTIATATQFANVSNGSSFNAFSDVQYDDYGHIVSATKTTYTLPYISINAVGVDATDKDKLVVSIKDQAGNATTATSGSILFNTMTVDGVTGTYANQSYLGSFYSKDSIDSMMRSLDALTYKGTITSESAVNALTNVANGDTYKAANDFTYNNEEVHQGDLLIATGTEDSSGYVTTATLGWTVVASGSDTDSQYQVKVAAGSTSNTAKIGLHQTNGAGGDTLADITADGIVKVTPTAGSGTGTLAFSHATSGATSGSYGTNSNAVSANGTITVPAISVDSYGHVTSISDTSITIPGDNKLTPSASGAQLKNAAGTVLGDIVFADGTLTKASVTATSSTQATVIINHDTVTATVTTGTDTIDVGSTGQKINAVSSITRDNYGHITAITTKEVSFSQIKYTLNQTITTSSNAVTINTSLHDISGAVTSSTYANTIQSAAQTIVVSATASGVINLDIEWGSFV